MTRDRLRLLAAFEAAVERHVRAYFAGHECTSHVWTPGPMRDLLPAFRVLEIAPAPPCCRGLMRRRWNSC